MTKPVNLIGAVEAQGDSSKRETEILVSSLVRAKRFYSLVFCCRPLRTDAKSRSAEYQFNGEFVRLKAVDNRREIGPVFKLRHRVDDFLYEYQRLHILGVKLVGSVIESDQGEMSMNIADDDGNIVTIVASGPSCPISGVDRCKPVGLAG